MPPLLYTQLADWFHLLSAPEEYAEESEFYLGLLRGALGRTPTTLLELGSGGGCMASHYKRHVAAVLSDLSPAMLALSRQVNPELEHVAGDMCTLRVGRTFDAVFVHDAVSYLTTEAELRRAMETAFVHCRPGGVALFAPDDYLDTFESSTDSGGHDGDGRGLRYISWTWDPDPADSTYQTDFAYLLHEDGQPTRCVQDTHIGGLFPRATWRRLLEEVGFDQVTARDLVHSDVEPGRHESFVCRRPT